MWLQAKLKEKKTKMYILVSFFGEDGRFFAKKEYTHCCLCFDLGYLKYDPSSGVFIEKYNSGQHPLENKNCSEVPEIYLNSIAEFLNKHFTLY